jgi:hypothetical protein
LLAGFALVSMISTGVAADHAEKDPGPLVRALWLVQRFGTAEALDLRNDQHVKGSLSKALGKENVLTESNVHGLIDSKTFDRLAGEDGRLDAEEVKRVLESDVPASRRLLLPKVAAHAEYLTTGFDLIDDPHRQASEELVAWIVKNYRSGQPLEATIICTGNTRRSLLGATMGNIAAAFYGMPEIRFHSGGTAPTALNPRSVQALRRIGVEVEPTGQEAPRGEPKTPNPVYRVRWGQTGDPSLEATEFSKMYFDSSNPQHGFAALMVCGEADAGCPVVKGAAVRISMPYLDPKIFDDSAFETAKYDERRDDMGRLMLAVMMQARRRLDDR